MKALPVRGPSLFNDHILDAVDKEVGINKRASEVTTKLRPLVFSPLSAVQQTLRFYAVFRRGNRDVSTRPWAAD